MRSVITRLGIALFTLLLSFGASFGANDARDWEKLYKAATRKFADKEELTDSALQQEVMRRVEARRILNSVPESEEPVYNVVRATAPWVFSGYRSQRNRKPFQIPDLATEAKIWRMIVDAPRLEEEKRLRQESFTRDSLRALDAGIILLPMDSFRQTPPLPDLLSGSPVPEWLRRTRAVNRIQDNAIYDLMIANPALIEYAYWDLPEPPVLPAEDYSFNGFLKRLNLPSVDISDAVILEAELQHVNWLHNFNIAIQLSQAYLSRNWYQGGSNYLSFLGNFLWGVDLNQVYHPKWMLSSLVSYKLAITSTPDDLYHKYSISTDQFQYNFKAGYKARFNWYYTFQLQFKTPFMRSYPANSEVRAAAFLSPGELNIGFGMTYSKENAAKSLKFTATISPISYNLKTCIDRLVDPVPFGIPAGKKVLNEVGSSVEANFFAKIIDNIVYTTRLFGFTDYKAIQADWENTFNFQFNKFFSTQLYIHLRYDSATDPRIDSRWKRLMMKEILSVGISYSFSTK